MKSSQCPARHYSDAALIDKTLVYRGITQDDSAIPVEDNVSNVVLDCDNELL